MAAQRPILPLPRNRSQPRVAQTQQAAAASSSHGGAQPEGLGRAQDHAPDAPGDRAAPLSESVGSSPGDTMTNAEAFHGAEHARQYEQGGEMAHGNGRYIGGGDHHGRNEGEVVSNGGIGPSSRMVTAKPVKRQSYSCAECKRLKLRCSREWPCTSCIRRGVEQICPNGSMTGGKAKRLILADTEELHSRIEQLEKALAIAHAKATGSTGIGTSEAHPLLLNTYLFSPRIKNRQIGGAVRGAGGLSSSLAEGSRGGKPYSPTERDANRVTIKSELGEDDERLEEISLGTLTIGSNGEAVFVGASAGSNYLHADGPSPPVNTVDRSATGFPFSRATGASNTYIETDNIARAWGGAHSEDSLLGDFPVGAGGQQMYTLGQLWELLPAWDEEGKGYIEKYWENASWNYDVIPRPIFDEDLLYAVYQSETVPHPHKLACVFLVMAIGVLFDPLREAYPERSSELFRLGRACLTVGGAFEHPCIATVQALNLMCNYLLNDSSLNGSNACWPILGAAMKIVISLGLHRDGSTFSGLTAYEIEERRKVFWEMIVIDRLQAMSFARPCSLSNRDLDTKWPGAGLDEPLLPDGDRYHSSKYKLVYIMEKVIHEQTKVAPGSYRQVKEIDDEIQAFRHNLPEDMLPHMEASALPLDSSVHPHVVMHRFNIRLLVRETRIYLHRAYFTKAIQDDPADPSRNERRFAKSFLAVFESAVQMISIVRQSAIYHQSLIARWWFFWFHSFSAAVCLAAVCIGAPASAFAMPAYQSLVIACDLAEAALEGSKAKNSLAILRRLRTKSSAAMMQVNQGAQHISPIAINNRSLQDEDLTHIANEPKLRRVTLTSPTSNGTRVPAHPASPDSTPSLTHDSTGSRASVAGGSAVLSAMLPRSTAAHVPTTGRLDPPPDASPTRPTPSTAHSSQPYRSPDLDRQSQASQGTATGYVAQAAHRSPLAPAPNLGGMDFRTGPPYIAAPASSQAFGDTMYMPFGGDVPGDQDLDAHFQYLVSMAPTHENLGNLDDFQTFLYHMQTDTFDRT